LFIFFNTTEITIACIIIIICQIKQLVTNKKKFKRGLELKNDLELFPEMLFI